MLLVRDGVLAARAVSEAIGTPLRLPWLMMSINDDEEDPHFRKAVFDPQLCPSGASLVVGVTRGVGMMTERFCPMSFFVVRVWSVLMQGR